MIDNFYTSPSYMSGGAYTIYSGGRRHRGGSFLGSLSRFMAPIGRQAVSGLKTLARNKTVRDIAKQAITRGAEAAANVTADALQGRDIADAIKQRSKEAAFNVYADATQPQSRKLKQKKDKVRKVVTYSLPAQTRKRPAAAAATKSRGIKRQKSRSRPSPPSKRKRSLSRAERQRKELF